MGDNHCPFSLNIYLYHYFVFDDLNFYFIFQGHELNESIVQELTHKGVYNFGNFSNFIIKHMGEGM